jgi:hypothetical protein
MKYLIVTLMLVMVSCGGSDYSLPPYISPDSSVTITANGTDTLNNGFWEVYCNDSNVVNTSVVITYPDSFFDFDVTWPYLEWTYGVGGVTILMSDFYNADINKPTVLTFDFSCDQCSFGFWAETDNLPGHPEQTSGAFIADAGTQACAKFKDGTTKCSDFVTTGMYSSAAIINGY